MKLDAPMVDTEKAENLILYVCSRMGDSPEFGSTVLNKVLYYVDHVHYLRYGKKLTGFSYVKQQWGPTPKPSEFLQVREDLMSNGRIEKKSTEYFGRLQNRLISGKNAELNLRVFSQDQIALIDEIIGCLSGASGKTLSDVTHGELSWQLANQMEELPAFAFLITEAELDQNDLDWADEKIAAYVPEICQGK
jgi:Protein of unknown function (DUF4065)